MVGGLDGENEFMSVGHLDDDGCRTLGSHTGLVTLGRRLGWMTCGRRRVSSLVFFLSCPRSHGKVRVDFPGP